MAMDSKASAGVEGLLELVQSFIDEGIVDVDDERAVVVALVRWLARLGVINPNTASSAVLATDKQRKLDLVAEYARFASQTTSSAARARKLQSMGVSPTLINSWARRYVKPGYLASITPVSARVLVLEYIRQNPGATRPDVFGSSGARHTAIPSALAENLRRGLLKREKNGGELYRWYATG